MRSVYNYSGGQSSNPYWTPGVRFLILANIVVFGIQILFMLLPAQWVSPGILLEYFALSPERVVQDFWVWQLVTSAFLHDDRTPFHILVNMLTLYFFGFMVERHYGKRKFLMFYFACAVFASLVYTVFHFIGQTRTLAVGASGAIMGVMMLTACLYPHNTVYLDFLFPMRLRTMIWIVIGINLYMALLAPPGEIAAVAHLGGLLFGYLYYRWGETVLRFWGQWENRWQEQPVKQQHKRHLELFSDDEPSEKCKVPPQRPKKSYVELRDEVDRLLEKISQKGIYSLTPQEREFLKKASKEYQRDIQP